MTTSATEITTNLPVFRGLLKEWTDQQPATIGFTRQIGGQVNRTQDHQKNVIVAFRTRPPLDREAETKFTSRDAVEDTNDDLHEACLGITPKSAEPGIFVVHVPGKKGVVSLIETSMILNERWAQRTGYTLSHKEYRSDLAFGPDVSNEEVYQRTVVGNNILPLVLSGGVGCILAYGQTSSGKTYTMEGIETSIARDLFTEARTTGERLSKAAGNKEFSGDDMFEFSVTFLQLLGKKATDLVEENGSEVAIREDKIGNILPGLKTTTVTSSEGLQELITSALSHRRVVATDRNARSSRSHALLTIRIKNKLIPYAEEGQLILVDLAGSERYEDSKAHDKQRMRESRENNESLMNLKECVRAKAKMAAEDGFVHIPWRSNKLTMLLKPLFDIESRRPSCAIIIAHVSPHLQDTAHSSNTLSYAAPFLTVPPILRGPAPYDADDPRTWDTNHTRTFLKAEFGKRMRDERIVDWETRKLSEKEPSKDQLELPVDIEKLCPEGYTAKNLGMLYMVQFVELCLEAKTNVGERMDVTTFQGMAMDVIGQLFYMTITAKTKSRNAVMKSRKKLHMGATYGDVPDDAEEEDPELQADHPLFVEVHERFPDLYGEAHKALAAASAKGENGRQVYDRTIKAKIEELKDMLANEAQGKGS